MCCVQAYNIDVSDMKQPLLLSMPKARDRRRGQEGPLAILPELCSLTGLYSLCTSLPNNNTTIE